MVLWPRTIATLSCSLMLLAACGGAGEAASTSTKTAAPAHVSTVKPNPVMLSINVSGRSVAFATMLTVGLQKGMLTSVRVEGKRKGPVGKAEARKVALEGVLIGGTWTASEFMEPSTSYVVTAGTSDGRTLTSAFTTKRLPLKRQSYASIYPGGGVVGVGQPVSIRFDVPVANRLEAVKHLSVTSVPAQVGGWHWISAKEVRWRPKTYWQVSTRVTVRADVNSVPLGGGIYGQTNEVVNFSIAKVTRTGVVNMKTQTLTVFKNGKKVRVVPVSTGEVPGFTTRSGVKVILAKHRNYTMNSGTIGIDPNGPTGYNLHVEYAMRLTTSGEFFHAAPWNTAYFGRVGRSHGCTGSSLANSAWMFNYFQVGDPITFRGSKKKMTLENGFGDWNAPFKSYAH